MTAVKWGIIGAVTAFLLSLFLGIIAGNQALRVIVTAFVFGITFFGMGFALRIMMNNFFPELLFTEDQSEEAVSFEEDIPRGNIALENSGEYAVPEMYKIPGQELELGNIEDLISGNFNVSRKGVDKEPEEEYNKSRDSVFDKTEELTFEPQQQNDAPPPPAHVFTPSFGDDEGFGGLPDLDVMAMAFSAIPGEGPAIPESPMAFSGSDDFFYNSSPAVSAKQTEDLPDRTQYKGNKPQAMEGDFDPKEIAQGIRTVLSKDK